MPEVLALPWDSTFFNLKIGRLDRGAASESDLTECLNQARRDGYELIYLMDSQQLGVGSNFQALHHCTRVDTKVVFVKALKQAPTVDNPCRKFGMGDDLATLYELAIQSGQYSRFLLDQHFKPTDFERFYRTWVDASLRGEMADDVFIIEEAGTLNGFVSIKYRDGEAVIGLIAVAPKQRGMGLGRRLMEKAEQAALERGCRRLSVATQRDNVEACWFYGKLGMELQSSTDIYHAWIAL